MSLDQRYAKTDAGRAEIKTRALGLSRTARNLLLVIDATKTAREWLGLVQGAEEEHFRSLLEPGLIAAATAAAGVKAAAPAVPAAAPVAPAAPAADPLLVQAYGDPPLLNYEELYSMLTSQAPKYLSLIKRYSMVLDVEKCGTLSELQLLGLQFVERVAIDKGEDAARELRLLLGLKG
ncbi:hypothetical protein J7U46_17010 [Pelomonas sp. V22]|uniref:hypothetical protein n=1 Tax=Pelomonas sp. V22 TaxID=2822139 RepID=UPI0024A84569|nr:hypothetical protein [Pelomonas sp. V22]MDI4634764.1 hypothetical protein [Pelomonas sp. V22]